MLRCQLAFHHHIINVDLNSFSQPRLEHFCHHLNGNPSVTLKKQSPRHFSKEHSKAVKEEVVKFKRVGAIREDFYLQWLANTVVVKKKNGKWRMCVDFTNFLKLALRTPS